MTAKDMREDLEYMDDYGYLEGQLSIASIVNNAKSRTAPTYEKDFRDKLATMRHKFANLARLVIEQLEDEQVIAVESSQSRRLEVNKQNGIRYFDGISSPDRPVIGYDPFVEGQELGSIELRVLVPLVSRAALQLPGLQREGSLT